MLKRSTFITSLVLVAVFAFVFGLSFVSTVQAGPDNCCDLDPTPHCNGGVGVWIEGTGCLYWPLHENPSCDYQIAPECF
jgi:hypothetical protein